MIIGPDDRGEGLMPTFLQTINQIKQLQVERNGHA
jgi:hypothetical protein